MVPWCPMISFSRSPSSPLSELHSYKAPQVVVVVLHSSIGERVSPKWSSPDQRETTNAYLKGHEFPSVGRLESQAFTSFSSSMVTCGGQERFLPTPTTFHCLNSLTRPHKFCVFSRLLPGNPHGTGVIPFAISPPNPSSIQFKFIAYGITRTTVVTQRREELNNWEAGNLILAIKRKVLYCSRSKRCICIWRKWEEERRFFSKFITSSYSSSSRVWVSPPLTNLYFLPLPTSPGPASGPTKCDIKSVTSRCSDSIQWVISPTPSAQPSREEPQTVGGG